MRRNKHESKTKHGSGWAAALWLLLPLVVLIVLKIDFLPQVARFRETGFTGIANQMVHKVSSLGVDSARWQQQPLDKEKSEAAKDSIVGSPPSAASNDETTANVEATTKDIASPITSKLTCNFSNYHSNTCTMEGDLRIHGKSARVYVVSASTYRAENWTIKIRPYARKWEVQTMSTIREVTMRSSPPAANDIVPLQCTVRHDVPAVIFSTGAYSTNYFHSMSDIIVPLYITAREYNGRVQLLATDYDSKWIAKYQPILAALSIYPVMDFDADTAVRCFPSAHVGLESYRILGIDPGLSRNGYTMMGFRDFLRSTFSLQRPWATPISWSSGQKPRLVMVMRRHSRALTNEADAIAALTDLGFEVVAAGPEDVRDMDRFAGVVNSCDVMVGVHGAGLTNMVFLPVGAVLVQVVPYGKLEWLARNTFAEPSAGMEIHYLEYAVQLDETTLSEQYPSDHPVLRDPMAIHKQGWNALKTTYLDKQNVRPHLGRLKNTFLQALKMLPHGRDD